MGKTALDACVLLLRPIASVLLRFGITWKEFSEISKRVFVEVATKEYGIKGRPTNASRVEILTGVNRREVMRLRKQELSMDTNELHRYGLIGAIHSGWRDDPDFSDKQGKPLALKKDKGSPSFVDLYKKYGKDIGMQTVLKELKNNGSVIEKPDGSLELAKSYFIITDKGDRQLHNFCISLSDYAQTSRQNYLTKNPDKLRLCGYADEDIPIELYPEFRQLVYSKGTQFFYDIDKWLVRHKVDDNDTETKTVRLGAGAYMIYEDQNADDKK